MFDDFFDHASDLRARGVPFATATVVRAEKPTSGKPGDKAIVTLDGVMRGWIGGSCAQPTVVREAQRAIAEDRSRLIRLAPGPDTADSADGVQVMPMTCFSGGTLDVYIEPHQPRPQLWIVGHLPVARALAHLGKAMGYRVIAVVDRDEQPAMAHADEVIDDAGALAERGGPLSYVVVATHGNDDERALEHALESDAPYVGLVASRKRATAVKRYLGLRGLKGEDLASLRVPAGLDIGARRGDEIALSIMAEIVQHRRSVEQLAWPVDEVAAESSDAQAGTAVDPVCGMAVERAGARHVHRHGETEYVFCCAGCLDAFATDPHRFLGTP